MNSLDLDAYRLPGDVSPVATGRPQRKRQGWFVWGPIPGTWIATAARLPGRTLHVALAVWYVVKRTKRGPAVLSHDALARFGVQPEAGRKALARLENAGLVKVERAPGCAPRVTIRETSGLSHEIQDGHDVVSPP